MKNIIEETLLKHLKEQNSCFVFPTQTAAELWSDRIVTFDDVGAVALERFIAWDEFKSNSIKSKQKDKTSIPSVLRKFFVEDLILQNENEHFFKEIINPEYADCANGFVNWITLILPSLNLWKNRAKNENDFDLIEKDLAILYEKYKEFLNKHNLFDPAWQTPPFVKDGNHYYVFFPEILSDYLEYKEILENSCDDITVIKVPEINSENRNDFEKSEILDESCNFSVQNENSVDFFSDSRTELKNVALYIRQEHDDFNVNWTDIALSVPDFDSYGPYIQRELELYQIPFVVRNATCLSDFGCGAFFSQAKECVSENFSFESVKNLLFNKTLPWKDESTIDYLIDFGKNNNCLCTFVENEKKIDVWESSFKSECENQTQNAQFYKAKEFYSLLKFSLIKLINSQSFKDVRKNYFAFRETFLDMQNATFQVDMIMSRCIRELSSLIDIQEKYSECKIKNPFSFFVNYLKDTKYLEQTENIGVQVIPYKLGSCAYFKRHIIVDSSQTGLSVIYKELSFLNNEKRINLLGYDDVNVSEKFINLYKMNCEKVYFTASNKTFTGYAQSCSYLIENDLTKEKNLCKFGQDLYKLEKNWFLENSLKNENLTDFQKKLTLIEKTGFENWKENLLNISQNCQLSDDLVSKKIKQSRFIFVDNEKKLRISTTSLKNFFLCPRMWLFKYISGIYEQVNEAELMDYFAVGNLNHKILELYCDNLKENNLPIHLNQNGELEENYVQILESCIEKAILIEKNSFLEKELLKTIKSAITKEIQIAVNEFSKIFEGCFVYKMEENFTLEKENYILEGKIDCILKDNLTDEYFLIDFKSGTTPKNIYFENENKNLIDFQMPMYITLLEGQKSKIPVDNCAFFSIKGEGESKSHFNVVFGNELENRGVKVSKKNKGKKRQDFNYTLQKFDVCLEAFFTRINEKNFNVDENIIQDFSSVDFKTCYSCDYKAVCRRSFNVAKGK